MPHMDPAIARRTLVAGLPVALISSCLAGCRSQGQSAVRESSSSSHGNLSVPAAMRLPQGWTWVEGSDIPVVKATLRLPVTTTDGTGRRVTIKNADRIIVGGEDVADILAALGWRKLIYAAPTNSVAEAAVNAPKHYDFSKKTGMEGLLSIDGTLFIGNNPMRHGRAAAKFRETGVDAAVVNDRQPIGGKIRAVATFLGDPKAGDKLAGAVERQLAEAAAITRARQGHRLRILAVTASGAGGANAVMGTGTASAEMIAACGATSVGVRAGLRGYSVKFTDEGLLSMKPDVILTGDGDLKRWGGLEGYLKAFPTLAQTSAGRKNHVFVMPSEQIKVSGVGVGAGAIALARALDALSR